MPPCGRNRSRAVGGRTRGKLRWHIVHFRSHSAGHRRCRPAEGKEVKSGGEADAGQTIIADPANQNLESDGGQHPGFAAGGRNDKRGGEAPRPKDPLWGPVSFTLGLGPEVLTSRERTARTNGTIAHGSRFARQKRLEGQTARGRRLQPQSEAVISGHGRVPKRRLTGLVSGVKALANRRESFDRAD